MKWIEGPTLDLYLDEMIGRARRIAAFGAGVGARSGEPAATPASPMVTCSTEILSWNAGDCV